MSKSPTPREIKEFQLLEAKVRLLEANKQKAREQLLRIQLLLAQKPLKS